MNLLLAACTWGVKTEDAFGGGVLMTAGFEGWVEGFGVDAGGEGLVRAVVEAWGVVGRGAVTHFDLLVVVFLAWSW